MKPIRVLLVDDHRVVRQGLRSILDPDPDFEVVGEASDGNTALELVAKTPLDVVLLDLKLPDIDGIEICRRILEVRPETAILVLTAYIDSSLVNACLQLGVRGYLLKDAENLHLRENLLAVGRGYAAYDPRAASILTDHVRHKSTPGETLKLRDLEILRLIAQGKTNREISARLHLSEHTVKGYVKDILKKLGVHSRIEAVMIAKERGIL